MDYTVTQDAQLHVGKSSRQRVVIILIMLLTLLVAYLDRVNISVLIADDTFLRDMGIKGNPVAIGSLMSLFLATYAFSNVFLSPLGDRFGARKVMIVAVILWAFSCLLGGLAASFTGMIVARLVLGVGEGMHWPMQMKFVKNWFPPKERARANSTWLVGLSLGTAIAMPLFVWIVGTWGWRMTFFFLVGVGMIPLLHIWYVTADTPRESVYCNKEEVEYIEAGLREEALEQARLRQFAGSQSRWENWKGFLLNTDYWLCVIFYFFSTAVWFGLMTWIPSYLKQALGFSWKSMGYWANAPYAGGTIACLIAGVITDKISRKSTLGFFHMLGGAVGIYCASHATGQVEAALWLVVAVSSLMIGQPGHWAIVQKVVPATCIGTAVGFESALGSAAGAATPVVMGYFIKLSGGSYVGALLFLTICCLLGMCAMAALWIRKV
jgi:sugar phosphate permease